MNVWVLSLSSEFCIMKETVIHDFVTSRLNRSNAVLYGFPKCVMYPLQKLQSFTAGTLTGARKQDCVTHVPCKLPWLQSKDQWNTSCHIWPSWESMVLVLHTLMNWLNPEIRPRYLHSCQNADVRRATYAPNYK